MNLFFLVGWLLVVGAFLASAAGMIARVDPGAASGGLMSARELWYYYAPGSFIIFQIRVERIAPWLWDPLLTGFLSLPTWLILGGPGIGLVWRFNPHRGEASEPLEDSPLFLYDQLAARARTEGYVDGDDQAPDHEDPPLPPDFPEDGLADGEVKDEPISSRGSS